MVECFWVFMVARRFVLATKAPSVSWLVVVASPIFCGSMLVVVAVAALAGNQLMVSAVFALPKETPRCLFDLLV